MTKQVIRNILQVLQGYQEGYTGRQVAKTLTMSEKTIWNYFHKFRDEGFVRGTKRPTAAVFDPNPMMIGKAADAKVKKEPTTGAYKETGKSKVK